MPFLRKRPAVNLLPLILCLRYRRAATFTVQSALPSNFHGLHQATIRGVPTLPVRNSEAKSWQPPVPFPAVEIPAENPKQKQWKSSVWERCPRSTEAVRSMAAVLLLGTGADEQLGGKRLRMQCYSAAAIMRYRQGMEGIELLL